MANIKKEIFDYLTAQGLQPSEQPFGIYFKYQMLNFLVLHSEKDEYFLRIAMPGIFDVDQSNRYDVLEAINEVNKGIKVVKAFIPEDDVWLTTEQLLDTDPNYGDVIPRSLQILLQSREMFYDELRKR